MGYGMSPYCGLLPSNFLTLPMLLQAVNLISKYGIIPQSLYPESFNSSNTGKLDGLLTSKLREFALDLRKSHKAAVETLEEVQGHLSTKHRNEMAKQSVRARKEEMVSFFLRYKVLASELLTMSLRLRNSDGNYLPNPSSHSRHSPQA